MDKPGSHNMFYGAAWSIIGVVLTVGSLWLFDWQGGVLFYGAILVGGIQFVIGVFQRLHYATLPDEKKAQVHAEAGVVTLLRCMALVANADGKVEDAELGTIAAICQQLMGTPIPIEQVRSIVSKVGHGGSDVAEFVGSRGTQTPLEFRILIAKACYMVMTADGEPSKAEHAVFKEILSGLGLPKDTLQLIQRMIPFESTGAA